MPLIFYRVSFIFVSSQQAAAKAALQAASSIIPSFGISPVKTMETEGGPNHVLHATIENCVIPVTIEALHKVFSSFGTVLKMVTFTRNSKFPRKIMFISCREFQMKGRGLWFLQK